MNKAIRLRQKARNRDIEGGDVPVHMRGVNPVEADEAQRTRSL
jgi:hypothetical protein